MLSLVFVFLQNTLHGCLSIVLRGDFLAEMAALRMTWNYLAFTITLSLYLIIAFLFAIDRWNLFGHLLAHHLFVIGSRWMVLVFKCSNRVASRHCWDGGSFSVLKYFVAMMNISRVKAFWEPHWLDLDVRIFIDEGWTIVEDRVKTRWQALNTL